MAVPHPARAQRPAHPVFWLGPLAIVAVVALPTLGWVAWQKNELDQVLRRSSTDQAVQIADSLHQNILHQLGLLQALREQSEGDGAHARDLFDGLGAKMVQGLEGLDGMAWLTPDGRFAAVAPRDHPERSLGSSIHDEPDAIPYWDKALREGSDQITPALRLPQGGWGFYAFFPIRTAPRPAPVAGVLVGFFRIQSLMSSSVPREGPARPSLIWRDDKRAYFESWGGDRSRSEAYLGSAELRLAGYLYRIEVLPAVSRLDAAAVQRQAVLGIGLFFALLAGLASRWALLRAADSLTPAPAEVAAEGEAPSLAQERGDWVTPTSGPSLAGTASPVVTEKAEAKPTVDSPEKAAEAAWRRSEDQYRRFFEEAPFGHLVADELATITLANRAVLNLLDCKAEDLLGLPLIDVLGAGRDSRVAAARLLDRVERGEELREEEMLLQRLGSRRRFWCSLTVQPMLGPNGTFVGSRFILLDITQRKSLEERLRLSAKMEAVGRLAGGISHDFNNLLTAILGFARLGLSRLDPQAPLARDLAEIEKAGRRAAALIAQLLAFSRQQGGAAGVVEIEPLIRDLAPMLRRLVREDIDLELDLNGAGSVWVDPAQLEQVIVNLVVNAMEAISGIGRIDLITRSALDPQSGERWVTLEVRDDGVGIPPEIQERIFEPFFSTKQHLSGTGLGLATVYGVVEQAGGNIRVESEPGQGTTFFVSLPQVAAASPPNEPDPTETTEAVQTGRERILLVEDEDLVREMAQEMLQTLGYSVMTARDGKDALESVTGLEQQVDLLLTDVVMPRMGGDELYRRLRELHPGLKVLFTSGYTDNAFIRQAVEKGEVPLLHKPFTLDSLAVALRKLLG